MVVLCSRDTKLFPNGISKLKIEQVIIVGVEEDSKSGWFGRLSELLK